MKKVITGCFFFFATVSAAILNGQESSNDGSSSADRSTSSAVDPFADSKTPIATRDDHSTMDANLPSAVTRNRLTEETLGKPIGSSFRFEEALLSDLVEVLRIDYDIECDIDSSAIDDELSLDTLITFQRAKGSLGEALHWILAQHNATFTLRNGLLVFISKDVAKDPHYMEQKIFNVEDILSHMRTQQLGVVVELPVVNPTIVGSHTIRGALGGGGGGLFKIVGEAEPQGPSNLESKPTEKIVKVIPLSAETQLENLIVMMITPEDWTSTSGEASLSIVAGRLIVTHERTALSSIESFLDELRSSLNQ